MSDHTLYGQGHASPLSQEGDELVQVSKPHLLAGVGILEGSPPTEPALVLYLPQT
jgi:hypothetical protein